ncbi:uncharacterized protein YcsI (UPF0317 family) [Actimicrobium sp. GrIS 1.19]|uniref:putative hydro-lyase n=1 Tax=Actimicrobium sp. GrIS 1.19 TaxID=3071708 RepID=UPI002DFDD5D9|nr:uncharacterized protein YcsI (UPF0317 family) [Actimicrobium sp. GrIS 1.19]
MTDTLSLSPHGIRLLCRNGKWDGATAGLARGIVQANLMIVPAEFAFDFLLFCQRNPKACPLIEVLEPGQFSPRCAANADLRSDLPGYRVYRSGEPASEETDIVGLWQDDFVSFLIGCSFSFESALMDAGIPLRHVTQQRNVAMYKTSIACTPAGRFSGNMVVSMRPIRSRDVARAVEISARFPQVHGAPLHIGHPEAIGIEDLNLPDYGDAVRIEDDEVPVFWACGVTPQYIACHSRIPLCITHAPGKMFVTDELVR